MEIQEYGEFREEEIFRLYDSAGWKAYTDNMPLLAEGFRKSLLVLAAYEDGKLAGILRAVGDGCTVVFLQDLRVDPSLQRRGIGTALVKKLLDRYPDVRQIQLMTDAVPETEAFYRSLGFVPLAERGCLGFIR